MFTCCGQGPLSFGRGLVRRPCLPTSRLVKDLRLYLLYTKLCDVCPLCAIRHSRPSAFHRPRSIRALVAFFARQFRSRPFRFTLSSFFFACYVAKSFFSSFCRRSVTPALSRSRPSYQRPCVCQVCHSFLSDLILITYLWRLLLRRKSTVPRALLNSLVMGQ